MSMSCHIEARIAIPPAASGRSPFFLYGLTLPVSGGTMAAAAVLPPETAKCGKQKALKNTGDIHMCGLYYIDDDTAKELERLTPQAEAALRRISAAAVNQMGYTHIHPSEEAPVLLAKDGGIACAWLRWGFPIQQDGKKGLVFNARCESAAEKAFFREGILHRRIVIPAAAFYEWDKTKTKYTFQNRNRKTLFMAGCCRHYGDGEHFVILTTMANSSMQPVHDRMPLLLEEAEVKDWILNGSRTNSLLRKSSPLLERAADYEQLSFL